jgi:hypothetical protein
MENLKKNVKNIYEEKRYIQGTGQDNQNRHPTATPSWFEGLESTCGKLIGHDLAHTCLYEVPQLTVHVRAKTKPRG